MNANNFYSTMLGQSFIKGEEMLCTYPPLIVYMRRGERGEEILKSYKGVHMRVHMGHLYFPLVGCQGHTDSFIDFRCNCFIVSYFPLFELGSSLHVIHTQHQGL
jgi:hypothetical protein